MTNAEIFSHPLRLESDLEFPTQIPILKRLEFLVCILMLVVVIEMDVRKLILRCY